MRIALCGSARSGKDTVAKLLGSDFVRLAFGDFMKQKYYEDNPHKVYMPKDREHMIEWSQPQVEKDNLIWVRKLEEVFMSQFEVGYLDYVITDLRQPHEEKWCRENGFHIVRVHSPLDQRLHRMQELGEVNGKDLEYYVESDFHIYNDGTLEDLKENTKKLLHILDSYDKIKTVTEEVNERENNNI